MKRSQLERKLHVALHHTYIKSEEYQDKYYLMKKIQEVIPELSDELIYSSIETCNTELKHPIKRDEFVKIFLNKIFPILYEKSRTG